MRNMRKLLLKIAFYACNATDNEHSDKNGIIQKIFYNGLKLLCMATLTLWIKVDYLFNFQNIEGLDENGEGPILSLTTFPARINNLWIVIDSFFHQTYRPSKILLVLTKEEFPEQMRNIPNSLKRLMNKGLEIVFVDYNLRPHNKYYYALNKYRNRDVVTFDDDLYYWEDSIERLYTLKHNNPFCICANRALKVSFQNGCVKYNKAHNECGHNLMAQGVGGVLYIPQFRTKEMFNKESIAKFCMPADDNWLMIQENLAGIKVATGKNYPHPLVLLKSQASALWHKNIGEKRSEKIMAELITNYQIHL